MLKTCLQHPHPPPQASRPSKIRPRPWTPDPGLQPRFLPPASASANSTTAASAKPAFVTPSKRPTGPPWSNPPGRKSSLPAPGAKPTSTPPADLTRKMCQPTKFHPPQHETDTLADWARPAPDLPVSAFPLSRFTLFSRPSPISILPTPHHPPTLSSPRASPNGWPIRFGLFWLHADDNGFIDRNGCPRHVRRHPTGGRKLHRRQRHQRPVLPTIVRTAWPE